MGIIWAADNGVSTAVIDTKKTFSLYKMFRKGQRQNVFSPIPSGS